MTLTTFGIVLFAALLHASWNAIVKSGADKLLSTTLVAGAAALLAVMALPFLRSPAPECWPFMGASVVLQIGYYLLVARIYQTADMSVAYPLMRGAAPLIVAVVSTALLGESLSPLVWLGIATICAGILSMMVAHQAGQGGSLWPILLNACVIAGYTLIDGQGVRRSGAPVAYTLWIFLLTGAPLGAWVLLTRRPAFVHYLRVNWRSGIVGGTGSVASYGLALWAMTIAPVAAVSALRETSIVFGALISGLVLQERVGRSRILAACVIAAGAVALRLA